MTLFAHRMFAAMATSMAALCGFAAPANAQHSRYGDPYNTLIVAAPSSYWGYTYNPYASMLHGAADVTRANGDYFIKTQQAAGLREKVRQERLVTRRQQLEQWAWERDFRAEQLQRERERIHQAEIQRALTDPPQTEILYAIPHNRIFDELRQLPDLPREGSTRVEPEWLAHINSSVDGRGNLGLLKEDRIFWPELLTRSDFRQICDKIEQLLARAKEQAQNPQSSFRIDTKLLLELRQHEAACREHLDREWRNPVMEPGWNERHFIEANRFLKEELHPLVLVLEKPNAGLLLNPLRGATVAELVAHMNKEGIRFAPATVGDDRAYISLHRALAQELKRLQQPELFRQKQ